MLDQSDLGEEVELEVHEGRIVIRTSRSPREGWEEQFKLMAVHGDDNLFDPPFSNTWDGEDWEW